MSEAQKRTAQPAIDRLWERINERGDFPMLSQSVRSAVTAMSSDDYDFTALVNVVLSDFALTQRVIRLANSAMYASFGGNVTTVSRALLILGMEAVGHIVVGLKLVDHFQSAATERGDARLELNRTLLSGCIARLLAEQTDGRAAEEAVVCTLMRQIGKLLVVCYLEEAWRGIQARVQHQGVDENEACHAVLGVSFEDLAQDAASRWRLPIVIRAGMRPADAAPAAEGSEPAQDASTTEHIEWLRAISGFSTDVSRVMSTGPVEPEQRDAALAQVAERYGEALPVGTQTLVEMTQTLVEQNAVARFVDEIHMLRDRAAPVAEKPPDAENRLRLGLDDLRAMPSAKPLGPVLTMASETVLSGLGFTRTLVFERRTATRTFDAKLGAGANVAHLLPKLRFSEAYAPDVFHLAIGNSVGVFIENAHDPKIAPHIPGWFREALPDAYAFVLLPIKTRGITAGLLYGDWNHRDPKLRVSASEMATLNDLARELSRFFEHTAKDAA